MDTTKVSTKDAWLKNEPVLLQITAGFGFNEQQSRQVLQEVRALIQTGGANSGMLSLRLEYAKKVVHKCVFLVSRDMFLSKPCTGHSGQAFEVKPYLRSFTIHQTRHMSLPVWVTYLLVDIVGFNDLEAASILNVHPFKLREHLNIARNLVA